MIKAPIPRNDAIFKVVRMFVAHYLTSIQGFTSFQNDSITLLSMWIMKTLKNLAIKVNHITAMQNKTESNIFHLMWVLEEEDLAPLTEIIAHLKDKRDVSGFNHNFFQKLKIELFSDQMEVLNKMEEADRYRNIHFTKRVYTTDTRMEALPFKYKLEEVYPFPPEYSWKSTRRSLDQDDGFSESSQFSALKGFKRGISQFALKRDHEEGEEQESAPEITIKKLKKINLLSDI